MMETDDKPPTRAQKDALQIDPRQCGGGGGGGRGVFKKWKMETDEIRPRRHKKMETQPPKSTRDSGVGFSKAIRATFVLCKYGGHGMA